MCNNLNDNNHKHNIKLIYEYAEQALNKLNSSDSTLNTKLGFILSFDAAFIRFSSDLPDNSLIVPISSLNIFLSCYSCLLLKILTYIFLILSLAFCVYGLKPSARGKIILPEELLEKCVDISEEHYRRSIIENWNESIKELAYVRDKKAKKLKIAVIFLGLAAILSGIDLLLMLIMQF
ncbi:MAG: hypothetical protein QNJ47_14035 [Nostocaceae cyanobacterium]|nr:hypothetical protein [Nostocaceae cyanobacterium]